MKMPTAFHPEQICSDDPTRLAITHCYLRGHFIFATDGRRIVQVPVEPEDGDVDGYIPVSVLVAAREYSEDGYLRIRCEEKTLVFISHFGATTVVRPFPNGARYPNERAVIGEKPERKKYAIALNVDYLIGLASALGTSNFVVSFDDPTKAIAFEGHYPGDIYPKAHAVLMPVNAGVSPVVET